MNSPDIDHGDSIKKIEYLFYRQSYCYCKSCFGCGSLFRPL